MKRTIIELNEIVEVSTVSSGDVYQVAVLIDGEMNHDEVFSNLDIKELFEVMFMLREKYPPRKK
jgi:hypothetical protein